MDRRKPSFWGKLDAADLANVRARRRASNRLGFAVQLCVLRHPGRVLDPTELPPAPMLAFVAKQNGDFLVMLNTWEAAIEFLSRRGLLQDQRQDRFRSP